jgi:hypothetical protein
VCNLYSVTTNQEAMRRAFRASRDTTGNLPGLPAVYPDTMAPVVRVARLCVDYLLTRSLSASVTSIRYALGITNFNKPSFGGHITIFHSQGGVP